MSWIVFGVLLISQSRVFPSLWVCVYMCRFRSCMSRISCMFMVSGFSGLFQGILKSPKMMIFLELLNKDDIWSGNSSKKVNIVTGCLIEYGALLVLEKKYDLAVISSLTVSVSKDVYSLKDNFLTCRCDLYITAIPPPFLFCLLLMSILYPAVSRLAFIY